MLFKFVHFEKQVKNGSLSGEDMILNVTWEEDISINQRHGISPVF
jgi:hypothetical protein